MTESEAEEWRQRLEAAVAETLRKRAAKRQERIELKARRDAGLVRRYALKTARIDRGRRS